MRLEKDNSRSRIASRRRFLKLGVTAGAAALAVPGIAAGAGAQANVPEVKPFELDEVSLTDLSAGLQSGKYSSRSLAEEYVSRIREIDTSGPGLNSVIELNPDALTLADSLDEERKSKGPRGPLHGIPILIKDNIGTADRMTTTAGSLALLGFRPSKDSAAARRLRESGRLTPTAQVSIP